MTNTSIDTIYNKVVHVIGKIVKKSPENIVDDHQLIEDLGLDSLLFLDLLAELEAEFGFELSIDDFDPEYFHSVRSTVAFMKDKVSA
ncbi:phosphopantetheine-binding protein [Paenibacillus sp. SC116]|uniref:phosphopantetheine-binding protein n=1 Tax=Paenibacillus sp. SC116 TaxID=2968986 RepID=UPI00215A96A4|nr:phosphopantetheine-binding protein [Paenibacillus sp. SC116]MCR8843207.1 phosphopantetheine-binding protein [Paenibacillus sp. SC116]